MHQELSGQSEKLVTWTCAASAAAVESALHCREQLIHTVIHRELEGTQLGYTTVKHKSNSCIYKKLLIHLYTT